MPNRPSSALSAPARSMGRSTPQSTSGSTNLRPWRKGQSGNPKGRPPMPDLREALANALGMVRADGRTALEAILEALVRAAVGGDHRAAQVLLDRAWGRPSQPVEGAVGVVVAVPPVRWLDPEELGDGPGNTNADSAPTVSRRRFRPSLPDRG